MNDLVRYLRMERTCSSFELFMPDEATRDGKRLAGRVKEIYDPLDRFIASPASCRAMSFGIRLVELLLKVSPLVLMLLT